MPATRRRTSTKLLRLHAEELAHIMARAKTYGVTPARFIRETRLGAIPRASVAEQSRAVSTDTGAHATGGGPALARVLAALGLTPLRMHRAPAESRSGNTGQV